MRNDKLTEWLFTNQFSSVMNKTKWRELAYAITSNPDFEPQVRVKYINDEESGHSFSHLDWEWIKFDDSRIIEWMDINPTRKEYVGQLVDNIETDFSLWVRQTLEKYSIPYSEEQGIFRVNGYLKPNG